MPRSPFSCIAVLALLAPAAAVAGSADRSQTRPLQFAQAFQPPGEIPGEGQSPQPSDAASLLVRIDRLEDQVRSLNGEIEQLQFTQKQLQDELQKFQNDVDFRFHDLGRGAGAGEKRRSDAAPPAPDPDSLGAGPRRPRRDDAFDPSEHPDAPGAPRSLGSLPSDGSADQGSDTPLQLDNGPSAPDDDGGAPVAQDRSAPRASDLSDDDQDQPQPPPMDPREDFDLALVSYNNGQLGQAEAGFRGFLRRHPDDRLAPEAVYDLGEIYWRGGNVREAAKQYLKISTDYPRSPHAPESLLKLGLALEKLGSKDQACASFEQVTRKYPNASASVRASVDRNLKRDKC